MAFMFLMIIWISPSISFLTHGFSMTSYLHTSQRAAPLILTAMYTTSRTPLLSSHNMCSHHLHFRHHNLDYLLHTFFLMIKPMSISSLCVGHHKEWVPVRQETIHTGNVLEQFSHVKKFSKSSCYSSMYANCSWLLYSLTFPQELAVP